MGSRYFEGDGHKSPGWIPDDRSDWPTPEELTAREDKIKREREEREKKQKRDLADYLSQHWLQLVVNMASRNMQQQVAHPQEKEALDKGKECLRLLRSLDGSPGTDEACRRLADSLMRGGRL